jgi:hypothetical protein
MNKNAVSPPALLNGNVFPKVGYSRGSSTEPRHKLDLSAAPDFAPTLLAFRADLFLWRVRLRLADNGSHDWTAACTDPAPTLHRPRIAIFVSQIFDLATWTPAWGKTAPDFAPTFCIRRSLGLTGCDSMTRGK